MHLTILSRASRSYSTRRLAEAARAAGHRVRVIDPFACTIVLGGGVIRPLYRGRPAPRTHLCIPRLGRSAEEHGLALLRQLALLGIPALNSAEAIARARSRGAALQLLHAHAIPAPPVLLARGTRGVREAVEMLGGCPVILELLGTGGRGGQMRCESAASMIAAMEALLGMGHELLVRPVLKGMRSAARALVVGGRVLALSRGPGLQAKDRARLVALAESAARALELELASVELAEHEGAPRVLRVDTLPSLDHFEKSCGLDLASPIVARAVELAEAKCAARADQ